MNILLSDIMLMVGSLVSKPLGHWSCCCGSGYKLFICGELNKLLAFNHFLINHKLREDGLRKSRETSGHVSS